MTIHVNQHLASFQVQDQVIAQPDHRGKKRFYVKVEFDPGNVAAFHYEGANLETFFEMIEAFGQNVKGMNNGDFNAYLNSVDGQRLFFQVQEDPQGGDLVTGYKLHRVGDSLEYAFVPDPHYPRFEQVKKIERRVLDYLKNYASQQQLHPHGHAHRRDNNLRFVLQQP